MQLFICSKDNKIGTDGGFIGWTVSTKGIRRASCTVTPCLEQCIVKTARHMCGGLNTTLDLVCASRTHLTLYYNNL